MAGSVGVGRFVDEAAGIALQIESGANKTPSKIVLCFIRLSKKHTRSRAHIGVMRLTLRFVVNRRKPFVPELLTRGLVVCIQRKRAAPQRRVHIMHCDI